MKVNQAKIDAVLALPGPTRYSHFIKVAADQRKVWGLFLDGWALAETNDGMAVFPIWPAMEYAKSCAMGVWCEYKEREIDLDTLFNVLLPRLRKTGTLLGVFPTPTEHGV